MFVNATQVSDMAIGGMQRAMEQGVSTFVQNYNSAKAAEHQKLLMELEREEKKEVDIWKNYATNIERIAQQMANKLLLLAKNYDQLMENYKKSKASGSEYFNYAELLIIRIKQVDRALQAQSANVAAYGKLREMLEKRIEDLAEGDPSNMISQEEQIKSFKEEWEKFNHGTNARFGVPSMEGVRHEQLSKVEPKDVPVFVPPFGTKSAPKV